MVGRPGAGLVQPRHDGLVCPHGLARLGHRGQQASAQDSLADARVRAGDEQASHDARSVGRRPRAFVRAAARRVGDVFRLDPHLAGRLGERQGGLAQLSGVVACAHGQAQPRGARRDGRRADRLGEDTALERPPRRARTARSSPPTTSGMICMSPDAHREALGGEALAQGPRAGPQARRQARVLFEDRERL